MSYLTDMAEESLKHPPDFAYYGDLHESDGWGRAFGQHRDSDALERSNWSVISTDLKERFPDDVVEESANHWAVGWVETLRIRVLIDPTEEIDDENITEVFKAVIEWKDKLEEYPVADEDDYCRLEYEEMCEYLDDEIGYIWRRHHDDDEPEGLKEGVMHKIFEHYSRPDDLPYKDLEDAVYETWIEGLIHDATQLHPDQLKMETE